MNDATTSAPVVASTVTESRPVRERDYRLDFFRGLALVFIFMDHIPDNSLSYLTMRSFALCDAAELFIFISGFTAAMVYGRAMLREGWLMASARVYRRVWQLYVAHLCLFMIYNAEIAYTMLRFNNPLFSDELRVGSFLDQPEQTFIRVLTLQFQPSLLNILPLYIFLLIIFPLALLAMRRSLLLALIPSGLLYLAVQIWGINMPGYPQAHDWFFNPFAWQFLFVIAGAFGYSHATGRKLELRGRWLVPAAVVVVVAGFALQMSWTLHDVFNRIPNLLPTPVWLDDKTSMRPARLLNMLALVYLVARFVPRDARFLTSRLGWLLVLCGQKSLYVFCLTILLSVVAMTALSIVGSFLIMQIVVNMAGFGIMVALGLLLAWFDAGGRLPPRPRPQAA